jgi:hypothetical protein
MAEEISQTDWAAHRNQVAHTATGTGLFGQEASPQARGAAFSGSPGLVFAGEQRPERLGHLAAENNRNQPGVRRLYASDIRETVPHLRTVIPGSSGDGVY